MRVLALTAALLLATTAAYAQDWTSQRFGNQTYSYGTDANGGAWSGTSQRFGDQTFSTYTGPNGQTRSCTSQTFGGQTFTSC